MSVACLLGLTACLTFKGTRFTAQDAANISDDCFAMTQANPRSFANPPPAAESPSVDAALRYEFLYYKGYVAAQSASAAGLPLDWNVPPQYRQVAWLRTCAEFKAAYNTKTQWTHLEKWPWK